MFVIDRLTLHAIRTQDVRPLRPSTGTALVQRGDVFESFASHEAVALLPVGGFLFGDGVEEAVPEVVEKRWDGEEDGGEECGAEFVEQEGEALLCG